MKCMLPVILIASAALLGACKSDRPVNTVMPQNRQGQPDLVDARHIVVDKDLGNRLVLRQVNTAATSGDLMRVQALVENASSKPLNISYQWEWYDQQGMIVRSPMSAWAPLKVRGGETVALTATAPNPDAVDYRLKLSRGEE